MADPIEPKRRATYEDLLNVPESMVAEILEGELYSQARPGGRHALSASALNSQLGGPFHFGRGGPGGWWILFEPELHLDQDIAVPDLAGWKRERMPEVPDEVAFTVSPDWVCEVISPTTERLDRVRKLPYYALHRVAHVWIVNPIARTLEVLGLEGERWVVIGTHGASEVVRAEPFEAVEVELGLLWGETSAPR